MQEGAPAPRSGELSLCFDPQRRSAVQTFCAARRLLTGEVRAGPVECGDKTHCDRVTAADKDDGYGRGR
jgi:hypothetical protein